MPTVGWRKLRALPQGAGTVYWQSHNIPAHRQRIILPRARRYAEDCGFIGAPCSALDAMGHGTGGLDLTKRRVVLTLGHPRFLSHGNSNYPPTGRSTAQRAMLNG